MKKNPWPYAIIGYFVIFIAAMTSWIVFAVHNDHELVRKDYYEQEVNFQSELDRAARSATQDAAVTYDMRKENVIVRVPGEVSGGTIFFYRPSGARLDRTFPLKTERGEQSITVSGFAQGLWRVRVSWSAKGLEYHHDETLILAPRSSPAARVQTVTSSL
jgi:hypothetical protein